MKYDKYDNDIQVDNLAFVWISHKHADHMLGLASVLAVRKKSVPPLLVSLHYECVRVASACCHRFRVKNCSGWLDKSGFVQSQRCVCVCVMPPSMPAHRSV